MDIIRDNSEILKIKCVGFNLLVFFVNLTREGRK